MQSQEDNKIHLPLLPTGKPHVSFSEYHDWAECSFRHKLKNIIKIDLDSPGPALAFGTAIHHACEMYVKNRESMFENFIAKFDECWEKDRNHPRVLIESYSGAEKFKFIQSAKNICNDFPKFMDDTFPGWEMVAAEQNLYEDIEGYEAKFKGYIDCIIRVPQKKKYIYWIIDYKTCSWGWTSEKKQDPLTAAQLAFYKHFWSKKANIDLKDIRCAFVLLKKIAKEGDSCGIVKVSVGDITRERAVNGVKKMVTAMKRGLAFKNRDACKYCPYNNTEHCSVV